MIRRMSKKSTMKCEKKNLITEFRFRYDKGMQENITIES